jgi:hypothetical protein
LVFRIPPRGACGPHSAARPRPVTHLRVHPKVGVGTSWGRAPWGATVREGEQAGRGRGLLTDPGPASAADSRGGPSGSLPRVRSSGLAPTPPPERRTTPLRSAHLRFPRRRSLRSSHPPPRWDAFFVSRRRRVSFPAALLSNQTARLALGASLLASSGRFRAIGWGCWCSLDGALGRRGRAPVS